MTDKADRWHQVEEICHAALKRLPGDRAAFLAEACAGDDGMRREVEALLANISRADVFLEQPVAAVAAQVMQSSDDALTGRRLNALVIGPLIGAGGMGRVYRARDAELHRDVAVKVLPPEFAHDADRLARFTREARVLASLNHPNIAQIHGLENTGDTTALVMELVEGETLADRIARGPIAADEALLIARQISEGLEAAHEQGVIHRDLKPANIRIRPDGMVKVLDFGLAKAIHQALDHADDVTAALSTPGAILGSAAYMAPEQAKGKPADRRVDLWALGCILFEMLTGRPAFAGETLSDVLVRIIEREPDWEALSVTTPAAIRRLLHSCLEKNPRRRLDSAAMAGIEIDDAATEPARVVPGVDAGARQGSLWRPVAWATTGAGVSLLAAMIITGGPRRSEPPAPLVVMSVVAAGLNLGQPGVHFSVAPNGRTVVFSGTYGTTQVLFRRDLDRVDPQPIVGSVNGSDVFFSPDSRWIGFERPSELWTTLLDGGSPQRLLPNHPLRGGTWGEGGTIIVGRVGSGLWMASATGGESRQLTVPPEGERHELPQMLPGGRAVLFTILSTKGPPRVAVHLLETGESRALFEGIGARFVGSGHVVFGRQGKLWAVGFDPGTLQPLGEARQVIDDVLWSAPGYPQFALDADLLAYVRASQTSTKLGTSVPILTDRQGKAQARPLAADNFGMGRFSPGGDRIVFQVGAARDLWIYDLRLGTFAKLTSDRIIAFSAPLWTPDGKRVIFMTWFDGEVGLGWLPADGSGPVGALVKGVGMRSFDGAQPVMLPDGSGVILTGLAPGASIEDLLIVRFTGEKRLETLFQAPGVEKNPAIAPNGRFIAYNSDESGHPEVYVRPFPNVGARRWQVSTEGGACPVWTRGGGELVYEDTQGRIMAAAVRVEAADEFEFSKPEPLFTFETGFGPSNHRGFDVTADGERFLFSEARPTTERAVELILIQNWADELRRLVPREP